MSFDTKLHKMVLSDDGSYTAFSKEYNEHYHSTKDGALSESILKHVDPAFKIKKEKEYIYILDICFGLGFNTLATLYYYEKNSLNSKLYIYAPELDQNLVKSLDNFRYPQEFDKFNHIIRSLSKDNFYEDENFYIELFLGDARSYIKRFKNKFDIVYQDAFSPTTNPILWTKEYFADIKISMKDDGVLTTYSTAFRTRLALYENDFILYLNSGKNFRNSTVASFVELDEFTLVDMEHKISCNKDVKSLRDQVIN